MNCPNCRQELFFSLENQSIWFMTKAESNQLKGNFFTGYDMDTDQTQLNFTIMSLC